MTVHKLKLLTQFCYDVMWGKKTFEIRKNDRDYQIGDHIKFIPYHPALPVSHHPIEHKEYKITYILKGWGIKDGYIGLAIKEVT